MPISQEARDHRRREILSILSNAVLPIESQRDIVEILRHKGIEATQSSVSRDLEALGAVRVNGRYEIDTVSGLDDAELLEAFRLVRQAATSGPYLTVINTGPASAKVVALAIERAGWPEVKGVIAEDATLFIATSSQGDQKLLFHRLTHLQGKVSR
jgi:transcriptional regulator of arginine metabolism